MSSTYQDIDVSALMPDPTQPRKTWIPEEIQRLAESITARGVLQPLRVMWDDARKCYLIVTGESRHRAAVLAKLKTVPCLVVEGQPDEAELLADRIAENACRHDLRPTDYARALVKLKSLKRCTAQQLAAELGISGPTITRAEALLTLPEEIQQLVDAGKVSESAAYDLSRLADRPESQQELSHAVASKRMNRDEVTAEVRRLIGKKSAAGTPPPRIGGKFEGVSITLNTGKKQPEWDSVLKALDTLRRKLKELRDAGEDISKAAQLLRAI
jgi:ParB family chromosome partitioning protein